MPKYAKYKELEGMLKPYLSQEEKCELLRFSIPELYSSVKISICGPLKTVTQFFNRKFYYEQTHIFVQFYSDSINNFVKEVLIFYIILLKKVEIDIQSESISYTKLFSDIFTCFNLVSTLSQLNILKIWEMQKRSIPTSITYNV